MSPEPINPYADWYPGSNGPAPAPPAAGGSGLNTGQWVGPDKSAGGSNDPLYGVPVASPGRRLVAGFIDLVVTILAPLVIVGELITYDGSQGQPGPILNVMAIAVGINSFALATSVGKKLMGIQAVRVIRHRDGQGFARVGIWRTLVRLFLHLLEVPTFLYFAAFLVPGKRTISDAMTHIIHVRVPGGPDRALPRAPYESVDVA